MAKDIWSGNEHFLKGSNPKKNKIDRFLLKPILIFLAGFILVVLLFNMVQKEETIIIEEDEYVPEDDELEEYRNLSAEELLAQLNKENGFKEKNPLNEIEIIAKKYTFEPSIINAKLDDKIRLKIRAVDINHSIMIPSFFIDKKLPSSEETIIEFIAAKTGEFRFSSKENENMAGKLIII